MRCIWDADNDEHVVRQPLTGLDRLLTQKARSVIAVCGLAELMRKWEHDASTLEEYSDARGAEVCRLHIAELREAIRAEEEQPLTVSQAAAESGLSADYLRHKVADGDIPNAGQKGAPRIRRRDLPRKRRGRLAVGVSPERVAADILGSLAE